MNSNEFKHHLNSYDINLYFMLEEQSLKKKCYYKYVLFFKES